MYLLNLIGEMQMVVEIIYLGIRINIYLNIVDHVGHKLQLVHWLIELILWDIMYSHKLPYLFRLLLIVMQVAHAMGGTLWKFINMLMNKVYLKKHVNNMWLKIQMNINVVISNNVWTVHPLLMVYLMVVNVLQ